MGRNRKYKQTKIEKNNSQNDKYKKRPAKRILRNSHSKEELSISLNENDKKKLHEISKMVNNVLLYNGNIEYKDVHKSIKEIKSIRLKTKLENEIVLCDKNINCLNTIQTVILSDSIISDNDILLKTNETSNDTVSSEVINNENKVINKTKQIRSEKNKLNKNFETLNEAVINENTTDNCIEELNSGLNETENIQVVNNDTSNDIIVVNTETTINEINGITVESSSKTKENNLPTIKKTVIGIYHLQPVVLEESEIMEINTDSSQETFCSELESRLVISQCNINTNVSESKVIDNSEFNKKSLTTNNISDCKKVIVRNETIINTNNLIPLNTDSNNSIKQISKSITTNNISNFKRKLIRNETVINSNNLIPLHTTSTNSTKQISKTIGTSKTQQFNYSPDESSSYSEQFLYYSKQNKTMNEAQSSVILNNNLYTCADFSDVTAINKTIPEVNNTLDNSMIILSHHNINNSDIVPESLDTNKNSLQDNATKITENYEISNNPVNTEKIISNEIILENIVPQEIEKSISEIEDISSQRNEETIPKDARSNELLQNFKYDKNASVLINIRKYQDIVTQKLLHYRETYKNSDDRIFPFEQDEKMNKNKFKSLFQKRNGNNSTLLKTNKISPKNTNLDVYQDVEKFFSHQNRTESLDDKDKIQTLTEMNLKELMYNWTHIKHNYFEK